MRASAVLLRWYKSFNINYLGYDDRQPEVTARPWNGLDSPSPTAYRFIEIPLRCDITTVVGANESGKSHLLSALHKVISGVGIPEADTEPSKFAVTDLCHYATVKDKNATGWPNVGAVFSCVTTPEMAALAAACDAPTPSEDVNEFTLILAHSDSREAVIYFGRDARSAQDLDKNKLAAVRKLLPAVEFIRSNVPLPSELSIDDLLADASDTSKRYFTFKQAQEAADFLSKLSVGANNALSPDNAQSLHGIQSRLSKRPASEGPSPLASQLFQDVIGIEPSAIELLASIKRKDRGFAEGLVATWNSELERHLNLRRFWQQDDQFSLSINFKSGWFYFEVRDKTGSVYTFRERSSGLRYFLSYYIQAKSIESRHAEKGCIVLMDEPDSFLSIAGQKNLLAVFESLVSPTQGTGNLQLVYTTHSPFLVNPNYPHRVRLVKKGDAEEGTQHIHESMLRRYEPVRSALGIDCAQTLFMGEANVLLEGPSDQYIIAELIRLLARLTDDPPIIDLTETVIMSAESAPGVEKVLSASKWGDEKIPATVVLFDSDDEGDQQRKRVTGRAKLKKLIDDDFVIQIGEVLGDEGEQLLVTTEDLIPSQLYAEAVLAYIEKWYPEVHKAKREAISKSASTLALGKVGNAEAAKALFQEHVFEAKRDFDKMGVLHEVVAMLNVNTIDELDEGTKRAWKTIADRTRKLLSTLRRLIEKSRQASKKESAKQAITRNVDDFFKRFKESAECFEIELLLERLIREVEEMGEDAAQLDAVLSLAIKEVRELRASGDVVVKANGWNRWSSLLFAIKKNPLAPEITVDGDTIEPVNLWSPDTPAGSTTAVVEA